MSDTNCYTNQVKQKLHPRIPVIKTSVKNLNLEHVKPQRAGVIIYTVYGGATFFCMGLDSRTHDLTDFGGTVKYKTDTDSVNGALREFKEETLDIFETVSPEDIQNCPVLYDKDNMIIFVNMAIDPDETCVIFNEKYQKTIENDKPTPEVCGLTWLSWGDFKKCIKEEGILFSRVRKFLSRSGDFSFLL